MKKSNLMLIIFILIGLLAGVIAGQLLAAVPSVSFLTHSAQISWHPKADLQVINYDVDLQIRLNLLTILGVVIAVWLYRKM